MKSGFYTHRRQMAEITLTVPFTDFPSWGTSSELEAGKAVDSPTVGSKEEAAMLPSGSERGSSSSKRRGEVDGGGDSELEAGARGDSPGFGQLNSPSHPFFGMVPGTSLFFLKKCNSLIYFFCRRSPIQKSVGRVTKKAQLTFFFDKRKTRNFFLGVGCVTKKLQVAYHTFSSFFFHTRLTPKKNKRLTPN